MPDVGNDLFVACLDDFLELFLVFRTVEAQADLLSCLVFVVGSEGCAVLLLQFFGFFASTLRLVMSLVTLEPPIGMTQR